MTSLSMTSGSPTVVLSEAVKACMCCDTAEELMAHMGRELALRCLAIDHTGGVGFKEANLRE